MKENSVYLFYYFKEIRYRIILSLFSFFFTFLITYFFYFEYLFIFIQPFSRIFIFTEMSEMISTTLRLSLWNSIFLIFLYLIYNYYCFITPSLWKNRRTIYLKKLIIFTFFIIIEIIVAFFCIPFLFNFFSAFEIKSFIFTIAWEIRIDSYFRFFSFYFFLFNFMVSIFYFSFKTLNIYKLFQLFRLKNKKNIWFFFLLFGASLAPGEIFSQLFLSISLYLSFESFLFLTLIYHKYDKFKKNIENSH